MNQFVPESDTMRSAPGVHESPTTPAQARPGAGLFCAAIGLALIALGLLIYRDFVFGGSTLLYKDIGSDSLNIFYPTYVLRSDYLRQVGLFSWSFQVGMGQNISSALGELLLTPVIWLPKAAIAKALIYQHLLYVVISGLLFASYLRHRGLAFGSALLGALLLSFSAYMCMGSCWHFHAYEVVCFSFLLFAAEQAVARGRWALLAAGVAGLGLLGAFHLYLGALFLCFYVPVRLRSVFSGQVGPVLRRSLLLAGVAFLGLGLTAIVSMGSFYSLLHSPRGAGPTPLFRALVSMPIFGLETSQHYATAILRMFAHDMAGTGSDFRGSQNYLEAPMSYGGLICLLFFPQIFCRATRRERVSYGLFAAFVIVPTIFPWFRYVFWAFQGDYYRTFSLFSLLGIITLCMKRLSRYGQGVPLNLWILGITLLILLGVLFVPFEPLQSVMSSRLRWVAAIFLVSYVIFLKGGQLFAWPRAATWAVFGLTVVELVYFDRITITRPVVMKPELEQRVGYNDETADAIRDIKASDHSFYRVTKTWGSSPAGASSPSLNDAMVFGYYGTTSYSSFNNLNYIKFLIAVNAISPDDMLFSTQWSTGTLGHPILSTFACEKYVLTRDPAAFEITGPYEQIGRYDSSYLFRNKMFVPLGLTFTRYFDENDFRRLPSAAKEQVLLYAVVLAPETAGRLSLPRLSFADLREEMNSASPDEIVAVRRQTAWKIQSFSEADIKGTVSMEGEGIMVLQTPFDPGWRAAVDDKPGRMLEVDAGLLGVALKSGDHRVELRYVPPFRAVGALISFISLAILGVLAWKQPRISMSVGG